jgi:hypothetical protein
MRPNVNIKTPKTKSFAGWWAVFFVCALVVLSLLGHGSGCQLVEEQPLAEGRWLSIAFPEQTNYVRAVAWGVERGYYTVGRDPMCVGAGPDASAAVEAARAAEQARQKARKRRRDILACRIKEAKDAVVVSFSHTSKNRGWLRFAAASATARKAKLIILDASGSRVKTLNERVWGGVPKGWSVDVTANKSKAYTAVLAKGEKLDEVFACTRATVRATAALDSAAPQSGVWKIRRNWTPRMELLFSVWVSRLFHVRPGSYAGWRPIHDVLKEARRNFLFNIFGWGEDGAPGYGTVRMLADCADAPYSVRAYFAWKLGLPFIFNRCNRGSSVTGPTCVAFRHNLTDAFDHISHPVERFNRFVWRKVNWGVHSGNGRTLPDDETSDFYPIALSDETLRPGTVFIDAAGHYILITQRQRQSSSQLGALFGVDAHPDMTVTPKRFSRGAFVFNHRVSTDGFKAFRPAVYENGKIRLLTNAEIKDRKGYLAFGRTQAEFKDNSSFYRTVGKVINPDPMDPLGVLQAKIKVLKGLTRARLRAIEVGEKFMRRRSWAAIGMPRGKDIFQTSGPWELYSTPARDMRYLIALDDVLSLPNRILKNPNLYALDPGTDKEALIEQFKTKLHELLHEEKFQYRRSDGSRWTLRLSDVMARRKRLEMGYNPNDCPEVRWGAAEKSKERKTCRRRAPKAQRRQMHKVRHWFSWRYRPTAE